jgi:hypothetical protein
MRLSDIKARIRQLLSEDFNANQVRAVAQKLGITDEELKQWVNQVDFTPNKSFAVWVLKGLKKGDFQLEDQARISDVIRNYSRLRTMRIIDDIFTFPNLNELENTIAALSGRGSKRQGYSGINPETLPGVKKTYERPDLTVFNVTDPKSLAEMGEGTKWCTRKSFQNCMAASYIKNQGSINVGYRDGKPFVQYNPDFSMVNDVNDQPFHGEAAKKLNLPPPNVKIKTQPGQKKVFRTVVPRDSGTDDSPNYLAQEIWNKWMKFTEHPKPIPTDDSAPKGDAPTEPVGRDLDFERRMARAIQRSNDPFYLMDLMYSLHTYTRQMGDIRIPAVEEAIVAKDFRPTMTPRGKNGRRSKIPGMQSIANYARDSIRGHWPELEKKLENDTQNSSIYYKTTGLSPVNVENPYVKNVITYMNFAKKAHPDKLNAPGVLENIQKFMSMARTHAKRSAFIVAVRDVAEPYSIRAKVPFSEVIGQPIMSLFFRKNVSVPISIFPKLTAPDPYFEKKILDQIQKVLTGRSVNGLGSYELPKVVKGYCENALNGQWKAFEDLLLDTLTKLQNGQIENDSRFEEYSPAMIDTVLAGKYARDVKNGHWPEAEQVIKKFTAIYNSAYQRALAGD